MTQPMFQFMPASNNVASGSSFQPKRKLTSEFEEDQHQPMNGFPPLKRRQTQNNLNGTPNGFNGDGADVNVPDLVHDNSNSASDDDIAMDHDGGMDTRTGPDSPDFGMEERDGCAIGAMRNYQYGADGSGGFGFGPGAEEDDMMDENSPRSSKESYPTVYPSLSSHPNPLNNNNIPFHSIGSLEPGLGVSSRPKSPLSAQAFSTSLPAPAATRGLGLMQPAASGPLAMDATAIDRARAMHGPQCTSIPRLQVSPYPDPATGKQTMYSLCPDCGTIEKAA